MSANGSAQPGERGVDVGEGRWTGQEEGVGREGGQGCMGSMVGAGDIWEVGRGAGGGPGCTKDAGTASNG